MQEPSENVLFFTPETTLKSPEVILRGMYPKVGYMPDILGTFDR